MRVVRNAHPKHTHPNTPQTHPPLAAGPAESARTLHAHTANCYCIEFSADGERFAVGGADALVSIWSVKDLVCERTCSRLEWPVRTLSFSHDSQYVASGSEDTMIDIAEVASAEQAHAISVNAPMNTVAWHPKRLLLAFAGDDKDKLGREGVLRIFGYPS